MSAIYLMIIINDTAYTHMTEKASLSTSARSEHISAKLHMCELHMGKKSSMHQAISHAASFFNF